jgi:hypothetical protein
MPSKQGTFTRARLLLLRGSFLWQPQWQPWEGSKRICVLHGCVRRSHVKSVCMSVAGLPNG